MNRFILDDLPAVLVTTVLDSLGEYALGASLLFSGVVLSGVAGALAVAGYRLGPAVSADRRLPAGFALSTLFVAVPGALLVGEVVPVVAPALVGAAVATTLFELPEPGGATETADSRRTLFGLVAAIGAYTVLAHVVGWFRREGSRGSEVALQSQAQRHRAQLLVEEARERELDLEGSRGLVSEIGEFYVVDIVVEPPALDASSWTLSVTGDVEEERVFGYDDLQAEETHHEFKTIRCLGDDIDDDLMDNALWTGCKLMDLVEQAGPQGEYLVLRAEDDYFYSMPIEAFEDAMLAWGMNARELPPGHGYPVRAIVPDRWGKLNVKWLREIEIVDESASGYWEERGWRGTDQVNAVAKIERIRRPEDRVRVFGHAYAGERGVSDVEVSTDGGESWESATLSDPLPDDDSWRQWLYEWGPEEGRHEFLVRAVDGDGEVQTGERQDPRPDGATGWVSRTIDV